MSHVSFNINSTVLVKMTAEGREFLKLTGMLQALNEAEVGCAPGWSRWQFWELAAIFGPAVRFGMDPPFETDVLIRQEDIR